MAKTLGRVVQELRKEAGLTRAALAKAAGLDPSALSRIETDERPNIRFDSICRLAEALGVTTDDIAARAGFFSSRHVNQGKPGAQRAILDEGLRAAETAIDKAKSELSLLLRRLSADRKSEK